jgi:hypothetical protein
MKCPNNFEVLCLPTWKNTLQNHSHSHYDIDTFSQAARAIGYTYILWDNRVYLLRAGPGNRVWETDTGWDVEDLEVNTAHSPELDRYINFGKDSL